MYERFSDRARKVMQLANREAQRLNHEGIGSDHIMLGLCKEGGGVAANVLKNLGYSLEDITTKILEKETPGSEVAIMGMLPYTPCTKKVIEHTIASANELQNNYVGTEHILLGITKEVDSIPMQVLPELTYEKVKEEILRVLGTSKTPPEEKPITNETTKEVLLHALEMYQRKMKNISVAFDKVTTIYAKCTVLAKFVETGAKECETIMIDKKAWEELQKIIRGV